MSSTSGLILVVSGIFYFHPVMINSDRRRIINHEKADVTMFHVELPATFTSATGGRDAQSAISASVNIHDRSLPQHSDKVVLCIISCDMWFGKKLFILRM